MLCLDSNGGGKSEKEGQREDKIRWFVGLSESE